MVLRLTGRMGVWGCAIVAIFTCWMSLDCDFGGDGDATVMIRAKGERSQFPRWEVAGIVLMKMQREDKNTARL